MARKWGPKLKALQEAIVAAVQIEQAATLAELPAGLQGSDFYIGVAVNPDRAPAKAYTIQVLPPADSHLEAEITHGFEGNLAFPCIFRVKALDEAGMALILRDLVGLFIDAIAADVTLGGLCAGTSSPAFSLANIEVGTGEMAQEVTVRFVARA